MEKRAGQGEALPHAARKLTDRHGRNARQTDTLQPGVYCVARAIHAGNACEKIQVFTGGEIFIDADAMAEKPEVAMRRGGTRRLAEDAHLAALKRGQPGDDAQESRLPRPVSPEQSTAGALWEVQRVITQRSVVTVEFPYVVDFDGVRHSKARAGLTSRMVSARASCGTE